MNKRITAATLAGSLGLTGVVLLGPTVASASDASPGTGRLSALKEALQSLVTDGTLTSAQADKVATTLDEELPRRGGHGGQGMHRGLGMGGGMLGHATVAEVLGVTVEELHQARQEGKTLAELAAEQGIEKADLIDELVAAAQKRLDEAVADERLTSAQSDARKARLEARITAMVDREKPGRGHGAGMHRGWGPADLTPSPRSS